MKKYWLSFAAVAALTVSFAGCGDDGKNGKDGVVPSATQATKLQFSELSAPSTEADKMAIRASGSVTKVSNNKTQSIGFTKLMATAETNNGETFGLIKDYQDKAVKFTDGSNYICNGTNDGIGSGLDHSSILEINNRIFMINQFECEVGAMYGMELKQASDGTLSVKDDSMQFISQTDGFGGWVHCAGMTTPWNSHLGSEEYEPNARTHVLNATTKLTGDKYFDEVTKKYWKDENNANASYDNNAYFYGYIPEVTVDASESTPAFNYTKHFSMGRAAWELAYVMPDAKTVYMSDDGTNVGFFMYVADSAEDLSAGTLYAAKWIQTSSEGAGAADLMWIKLGHATDAEIKAIVATQPAFTDIFYTQDPVDGACPTSSYSYLNNVGGFGNECLKLKSGKEKEAAFLETRRYAAMLGATTEFRKEEGITFNAEAGQLYVAMSQVAKGMSDGKGDIQLEQNKCGAVYALDVVTDAYDASQNKINSEYVVGNEYGIIAGSRASYPAGSAYESYYCSVNGLANPDNVTYLPDSNILAIGEDTGYHPNDFVWAYDVVSGNLTRILSTPYGSETTSPYWETINGKTYLTVVTQHPYGEVENDADAYLADLATSAQKESFVGVVGPFKY